jgi:hypothetical protein
MGLAAIVVPTVSWTHDESIRRSATGQVKLVSFSIRPPGVNGS